MQVGVFQSRRQSVLAVIPIERQGALDQQQTVGGTLPPYRRRHSGVMRLGTTGIVLRVIDAVDRRRLGSIRRRREREVGIATGFTQNRQLVVHSTPAAIGPRVVERPISVDESVGDLATLVSLQETMAIVQCPLEPLQSLAKILGSVAIMMQMNFDLPMARVAQFG